MFLRLVPYCILLSFPLSVGLVLMLPALTTSGFSPCLDSNSRLNASDALISTYYFWWTNLTYLPLFFFTILFVALLMVGNKLSRSLFMVTCISIMIYPLELFDHLTLNTSLVASSYHSYGNNILLTNALNRYHPFVFYMSTCCLLIFNASYVKSGLFNLQQLLRWYRAFWISIFVNLIALWMGSWWALQEGTWGGWWNWDSSETFGLTLTLFLVSIQHSILSSSMQLFLRAKMLVVTLLFVLTYFFIQLNFELVSHNFGSKFFFFFNNNFFFLEASLLVTFVIFFTLVYSYKWSTLSTLYATGSIWHRIPVTQLVITRILVPIPLFIWTILSYQPLFSYFMWNFTSINLLNVEYSFQYVNTFLLILGIGWLVQPGYRMTFTHLLTILTVFNWKHLASLCLFFSSPTVRFHSLLIFLTLMNLTLFDLVIYKWMPFNHLDYFLESYGLTYPASLSLVSAGLSVEYGETWLSHGSAATTVWNMTSITNTPLLNFFTLTSQGWNGSNYYNLSSNYTTIYFYIEIPQIHQLTTIFLMFIVLAVKFVLRKQHHKII